MRWLRGQRRKVSVIRTRLIWYESKRYGRLGRYVVPRAEKLRLVAPGLKYNTDFGLKMGLQVGAATAGSLHGLHVSFSNSDIIGPTKNMIVWACRYSLFEARGNDLGSQLRYCRERVCPNCQKKNGSWLIPVSDIPSDFTTKEIDRVLPTRLVPISNWQMQPVR